MLNGISWIEYWTTTVIVAGCYYIIIALLCYGKELKILFLQPSTTVNKSTAGTVFANVDEDQLIGDEELPTTLQPLMDELQAYIQSAAQVGRMKEEMIYAMKQIINKYPGIKNSEYKLSVNRLIEFECEQACSIHLSAEDVHMLWKD